MDLNMCRFDQQDHWIGSGLSHSAHEAWVVLHFGPLGQGGPRPLVAGRSGIALEGDLENLVCLRQRGVGGGSKGLAWSWE